MLACLAERTLRYCADTLAKRTRTAALFPLPVLTGKRVRVMGANLSQDRQSLGRHAPLQAGHPVSQRGRVRAKPGPNPTFCAYWIVRVRGR
jgi:hypothetical protein